MGLDENRRVAPISSRYSTFIKSTAHKEQEHHELPHAVGVAVGGASCSFNFYTVQPLSPSAKRTPLAPSDAAGNIYDTISSTRWPSRPIDARAMAEIDAEISAMLDEQHVTPSAFSLRVSDMR